MCERDDVEEGLNSVSAEDFEPSLFVSPPDDRLICAVCMSVARQPPCLPKCAHVYCRECLQLLPTSDTCVSCPSCRERFCVSKCPENRFVSQQIQQLQLRCRHAAAGCPATFVLGSENRNLINHRTRECDFRAVRCREVGCRADPMVAHQLAEHLASVCSGRWAACQWCAERLERSGLSAHTESCPRAMVKCEECWPAAEYRRSELAAHVAASAHKHELDTLRRQLSEQRETLEERLEEEQDEKDDLRFQLGVNRTALSDMTSELRRCRRQLAAARSQVTRLRNLAPRSRRLVDDSEDGHFSEPDVHEVKVESDDELDEDAAGEHSDVHAANDSSEAGGAAREAQDDLAVDINALEADEWCEEEEVDEEDELDELED